MKTSKFVRLTAEQQALAAGCVPLARWLSGHFARSRGLDAAECESVAQLFLCRAAANYDPARGVKFSTFAGKVMRRGLVFMAADTARRPRLIALSVFPQAFRESFEPAASGDPVGAQLEEGELLDRILQALPARWWNFLRRHYLDGLTLEQVGAEHGGISKQRVQQVVAKAIRRAREALPRLDNA